MFDIVALGESLIDFTPSGENSQGMALFARNTGGAPANVLAMAAKLGGKTAFIGKVGDDAFGAFLKKTMEDAGVDVRGLRMTREYPTTLAFVQLTPEGERFCEQAAGMARTWFTLQKKHSSLVQKLLL